MRPFLLIWNPSQLLQQHLIDHLDTRREIRNYYVPFLGSILLIADQNQTPSSISNLIHSQFSHLLIAVTPADQWSTNGWMPQVFWDLIREPKSSGRWEGPSSAYGTLADILKLPPKK